MGLTESTSNRRVELLEEWGYVKRLKGSEAAAAYRANIAGGGLSSSRRPILYGRGPKWLEVAADVEALIAEGLAARLGSREGRELRVHHVTLTCEFKSPPARLTVPGKKTGEVEVIFTPRRWGSHGQILHERNFENEGLQWRAVLFAHPSKPDGGWSSATVTLAKESAQWVDAGQVHAFTLALYESAVRAMNRIERWVACRLSPMHLLDFAERVHAGLGIEGPVAEMFAALPAQSREWTLIDGRRVWADFSDGAAGDAELEAGLPSKGAADALTVLDESLAWALKNPEGLNNLRLEIAALTEQVTLLITSQTTPAFSEPLSSKPDDSIMFG
jgi:hypothetical protein